MKKLLVILAMVLLCAGLLCACNKEPEHIHAFGDWEEVTTPTCTQLGLRNRACACGYVESEELPVVHEYGAWVTETAATCQAEGKHNRTCTLCGNVESEALPITFCNLVRGKCTVCNAEKLFDRADRTITFGNYPQSDVTDAALISTLNGKAGDLPTADDAKSWNAYGTYASGTATQYMWYIDLAEGANVYRGVYFTNYRPFTTAAESSAEQSWQDDNGYATGTVYWFRFDPILWTVLEENKEGTKALIVCNMILEADEYYADYNDRTENGIKISSNNYAKSTIRAWLNDAFYKTAFTELQQGIILAEKVDNSSASTGYTSNPNFSADTEDKIFLLSCMDMIENKNHKFNTSFNAHDTERQRLASDYAACRGVWTDSDGFGSWWLRSPNGGNSFSTRSVDNDGDASSHFDVTRTDVGVVPALWIKLK